MHKRVPILLPIAASVLLSASSWADVAVEVAETEATIEPRKTLRAEIRLPPVAFEIAATLSCAGQPVSFTLSVADVHKTWRGDQLDETGVIEASISVPPPQLALVLAGSPFCLAGDSAGPESLLVPGVATAQASLQCASETGTTLHYASAPLPLRLLCQSATDQVPDLSAPK